MCPRAQGFQFLRPNGERVVRYMACDVKACEVCGSRLRARWAGEWAHAMAGDTVYRLLVADDQVAKLRRRKALAGHELAVIPAPEGRVVYTTAPIGEGVDNINAALTSDFAAMPNDTRRRSITPGWSQVIADAAGEAEAKRESWVCEGRVGRSLDQVAMVAAELGVLVGRGPAQVVIAAMDLPTEQRFKALVRLQRGYHRRQVAA